MPGSSPEANAGGGGSVLWEKDDDHNRAGDEGRPRLSWLVVLAGGVLWEGGGLETVSVPPAALRALAGEGAPERPGVADDYREETMPGRPLPDGHKPVPGGPAG